MSKLSDILYDIIPAPLQNLAVSYYGLKLYRREYGPRFREKLEEFEKMQWWSLEQLREYQEQRLGLLIGHCFENVPYYRDIMKQRRLTPDDIRRVGDLDKLPLLTRDDVRNNYDRLIARNFKRSQLIHGHTSGTTGSPLQFYYDGNVCRIKNVFDWRQKRWAGLNPGDRIAFFLGRIIVPLRKSTPPFWRMNYVLNHMFYSSFHLSADNFDAYLRQLKKFCPTAIEGYPSTIYLMARLLLAHGEKLPLKAALTSSETLFKYQRETIEKAFECSLFDFYGLAERTVFASECDAHEGRHLNLDFGITEILNSNDQAVAPGHLGFIVATGLHNYAMPLIRYRLNDVTTLKEKDCFCGRAFPLMEDITTKAEDIITTKDGRFISSSILTHPFKPLHSIAESQIIQEDREHIIVKIVRFPTFTDHDSRYLIDELRKRLGKEMSIVIEFTNSIPRTASGKFRWVISKVPLEI